MMEQIENGNDTNRRRRFVRPGRREEKRSLPVAALWLVLLLVFPLIDYILAELAMQTGCAFLSIGKFKIVLNCAFYGIAELFFLALTASLRGAVFGGAVFAALFAITNIYLMRFTSIPLYVTDLTNAGTAANVIGNYNFAPNRGVIMMVAYLVVLGVVLFGVLPRFSLRRRWLFRLAAIPVFAGILLFSHHFVTESKAVKNHGVSLSTFRPIKSYRANGGLLTFMRSFKLLKIEVPEGYSVEAVEAVARAHEPASSAEEMQPNVIVIMDEAFSDLQHVGSFETSEPVLPVYESLTENTVKGDMYVSVFGGHTANTEYEFLSGDSCAFLPSGITAYQVYINSRFPGLATLLQEAGYDRAVAVHPYLSSGYNRSKVYGNMGFDDFISVDGFEDPLLVRQYVSDQSDFDKLIEEYEEAKAESDAPFFAFNVTMQNHGGYTGNYDNYPDTIRITSDYVEYKQQAEQYLNLIHLTDRQIGRLTDYFAGQEDPTVIVLFGDHQPGLPDDFYSSILGENVGKLKGAEMMNLYHTPFLIWANYDIEERTGVKLSANFLQSYMMQVAGMRLNGYNQFLADLQKEVPIVTAKGCIDAQGSYFKISDAESPYYDRLLEYHWLCYNHLFDTNHRSSVFELETVGQ